MSIARVLVAVMILHAGSEIALAKKKAPPPTLSGIQHVVVVMMENRSFDHFLGWLPNADGRQAGLTYTDDDGSVLATMPLRPDFQGCSHPDPDHSWAGGRVQYDGGAMDGFLRSGMNDAYAIGYYEEQDRPFFGAFARAYTTCDRFFAAILAEDVPEPRLPARRPDRPAREHDGPLDAADDLGPARRQGHQRIVLLLGRPDAGALGAQVSADHAFIRRVPRDAAAGTLPHVSFVDPRFLDEASGTSGDDHPHADIRTGDAFLAQTFDAVVHGPGWKKTVFIVTYDEWGGFFEHVAPPRAAAPNAVDPDIQAGKTLLGFRVPVVVASPWSRGDASNPRINSQTFDHTSVLKLIEWRWNLAPLTARDASTDVGNLVDVLDFDHPDPSVPSLPQAEFPPIAPCIALPTDEEAAFTALRDRFFGP
jgi:phospholipase C